MSRGVSRIADRYGNPSGSVGTVCAADEIRLAVATSSQSPSARSSRNLARRAVTRSSRAQARRVATMRRSRMVRPFDVFFAADVQCPTLLEQQGFGVRGSRFLYAVGWLAFCSRSPDSLTTKAESETVDFRFRHRRPGAERRTVPRPARCSWRATSGARWKDAWSKARTSAKPTASF